ncbi:hypothetical protein [Mycobacterium branderi]|uniref:Uncharacterized protein n=1 Tax=Mycobacterium branderi TaxID=43348 RepID=A0ABN6AZ79_9MYCO|nr:hypothetical protein [Mycobacterium branderi]BBZ09837.1 hypothetical protein MBRA_00320 [Mycobacterium branderi]
MTSPTQSGASTPEPETAAIRTTATPDLPLAYSDLDEDDEDLWSDADDRAYAWGTVKIFVGLMAVAVAAAAWMAGVWLTRRDNAPRSAPSTPAVAAAAPSYSLAAPVPTSAPTPTVAAPRLLPSRRRR